MTERETALRHVGLMGAQGSGKGTQAAIIAPRAHLDHLSTGDLFRAAIATGDALGQEIKAIYDRGDLIPDGLTLRLVDGRLNELAGESSGGQSASGALFDGFPRTAGQAEGLDKMLAGRGESLPAVVLISVPRDVLESRLSGRRVCPNGHGPYHVEFNPPTTSGICDVCGSPLSQRDDDQPEAIQRRLATYFAQTQPLVEYYRTMDVLVEIDGNQAVDQVSSAIAAALRSKGVATDGAGETELVPA